MTTAPARSLRDLGAHRPKITHRARGDAGAATAEMVLVTPAMLLLIMIVVQVGLWFHANHVATAAAQEGARAARSIDATADAGQAKADAFLDALGREIIVERSVVSTRDADQARVEVRGYAVSVVPGVRLPVAAASEGPVERFRAHE